MPRITVRNSISTIISVLIGFIEGNFLRLGGGMMQFRDPAASLACPILYREANLR